MSNRIKIFFLVFVSQLAVVIFSCAAQDPQFSQFYSAQLYMNPAFTGNTIQDRVTVNYRKQWPGISGAFESYAFSYDHKFSEKNSALGIQVIRDKAGSGGLKFTNIGGLYSYVAKLSRKHFVRGGLRLGYTWRALDYAKLTFADQLIREGDVETIEPIKEKRSYFDIATGFVYFSEIYWIGVAFNHLNRPNQSFIGIKSRLSVKFDIHGGITLPVKKNVKGQAIISVTIAANYKAQQKWDQLDIGAYFRYDPLILGIWYRGIPLLKSYQPGYANNDALILLIGYHLKAYRLRLGYSYDITISPLRSHTGGAHEISLSYEYAPPEWKKKRNFIIPCASF
ncbi:MAG: hypothetical protein COB85_00545 [Bacteroidetes bacterium]|nr:MAG: hypothetical protein COB85_00545 [Bacteroidota bacterium]